MQQCVLLKQSGCSLSVPMPGTVNVEVAISDFKMKELRHKTATNNEMTCKMQLSVGFAHVSIWGLNAVMRSLGKLQHADVLFCVSKFLEHCIILLTHIVFILATLETYGYQIWNIISINAISSNMEINTRKLRSIQETLLAVETSRISIRDKRVPSVSEIIRQPLFMR